MSLSDDATTDPAGHLPSGAVRPRRRLHVRTLVVALLVAAALLLILDALGSSADNGAVSRPPQFEVLEPEPGAINSPAQSTVAADLAFGWTGVLVIQGTEIPKDQLDYVRATARLSFSPGEGKELTRLPGGQVRVTAVVWPLTGTRERDAVEHTWYFDVL